MRTKPRFVSAPYTLVYGAFVLLMPAPPIHLCPRANLRFATQVYKGLRMQIFLQSEALYLQAHRGRGKGLQIEDLHKGEEGARFAL